ncbi:hypothetical protein B0H13DRAFT_2361524 [Mycena leptocephala]|nr:hypothetical protein B0H13DRAFT_2361524 [Mycena leptocephala]
MVDASTVDCNAKEDDDEPGGEMCTDTTRTHFGLGPSSHMPTQRSSYYSLLFALAATILLLSPLLLRIATRPLAEPGALRLLKFGEIASGRQRVPATTTALSGSSAVEPWNRGTVQGENERIANEVHHRVEVLLRLDDGDGAVPPLQEGSDSEDEDDMPPLLECSETEDEDDSDREFEDDPEMRELLSVSDSDEENESDTDSDDDSDIPPLQDVSDSEDKDDSPMNGQFRSARIHNLSGNAGLNRER